MTEEELKPRFVRWEKGTQFEEDHTIGDYWGVRVEHGLMAEGDVLTVSDMVCHFDKPRAVTCRLNVGLPERPIVDADTFTFQDGIVTVNNIEEPSIHLGFLARGGECKLDEEDIPSYLRERYPGREKRLNLRCSGVPKPRTERGSD